MVNWSQSGFTDCFPQLHLPQPEELGMLLTTPYVVCGTGCVGAVWRAPGGHTRSLREQVFALIKVAPEMKYYVWFYNFHNWDSRGFFIYHSWLPAGLFLKKSACYNFFPPSNLMLLDYHVWNSIGHVTRPPLLELLCLHQVIAVSHRYSLCDEIYACRLFVDAIIWTPYSKCAHHINSLPGNTCFFSNII